MTPRRRPALTLAAVALALAGCGGGNGAKGPAIGDPGVGSPAQGTGFNVAYQPAGDPDPRRSLRALRELDATFERGPVSWAGLPDVSPTKPVGADLRTPLGAAPAGSGVAALDRRYADLLAAGITPVLVLDNAPAWATKVRVCLTPAGRTDRSRCPPGWQRGRGLPDPAFFAQWRAWVSAIARRYPKAILEGPNEPDLAWLQHRRDPRTYPTAVEPEEAARIQCELHRAVRAVDGRTVLSMSMGDPTYLRRFVAAASDCYDAFSFHLYPRDTSVGAGSDVARALRALRSARRAADDESPVWVTETGFTFVPRAGDSAHNAYWERRYAAGLLRLRGHLLDQSEIDVVLLHTLRDAPLAQHADPRSPEYHYGLFRVDWTAKPRACVLLRAARGTWRGC